MVETLMIRLEIVSVELRDNRDDRSLHCIRELGFPGRGVQVLTVNHMFDGLRVIFTQIYYTRLCLSEWVAAGAVEES